MLAYAPRREAQRIRPATLLLIVAGHAAALAAVMSAKMVVERISDPPIIVDTIRAPTPPPPVDEVKPTETRPATSTLDNPDPIVPPLPGPGPIVEPFPQPLPQPGPVIGTGTGSVPVPFDPPIVRTGPKIATAADLIRPPYPASKRETGDEASLRLRLAIDERGRVLSVDPVGRADPAFLETARRHILRVWHYRPAMEGSKAVPSTTTITLKFELGNA